MQPCRHASFVAGLLRLMMSAELATDRSDKGFKRFFPTAEQYLYLWTATGPDDDIIFAK